MLENGLIDVGPVIPEDQPVFHFESAKEDEDEDLEDDYEPCLLYTSDAADE